MYQQNQLTNDILFFSIYNTVEWPELKFFCHYFHQNLYDLQQSLDKSALCVFLQNANNNKRDLVLTLQVQAIVKRQTIAFHSIRYALMIRLKNGICMCSSRMDLYSPWSMRSAPAIASIVILIATGRPAISKVKCVIYISQQQLQLHHSPHSIEQTQMPILQISNVQSHTRVGRFSSARGVSVVHCPFEAKTQIKN